MLTHAGGVLSSSYVMFRLAWLLQIRERSGRLWSLEIQQVPSRKNLAFNFSIYPQFCVIRRNAFLITNIY